MEYMGAWISLEFEVIKTKEVKMLRLICGLISFGGYKLPVDHFHYAGSGGKFERTLIHSAHTRVEGAEAEQGGPADPQRESRQPQSHDRKPDLCAGD
jgi:hypothetical protein